MGSLTPTQIINQVFEDSALVLGGCLAGRTLDDDFVWELARGLDDVRLQAIRRFEDSGENPRSETRAASSRDPHPAIQELLRRIHATHSPMAEAAR